MRSLFSINVCLCNSAILSHGIRSQSLEYSADNDKRNQFLCSLDRDLSLTGERYPPLPQPLFFTTVTRPISPMFKGAMPALFSVLFRFRLNFHFKQLQAGPASGSSISTTLEIRQKGSGRLHLSVKLTSAFKGFSCTRILLFNFWSIRCQSHHLAILHSAYQPIKKISNKFHRRVLIT